MAIWRIARWLVLLAAPLLAQAQDFSTEPALRDALLTEGSGERLTIELGCPEKAVPCGGRFSWKARQCWGNISTIRIDPSGGQEGRLELAELLRRPGSCEPGRCSIILEPGWGRYSRVCKGRVVATGRFDKGRNVELFGSRVDRREFYQDPNAAAIAAAIPPPPAKLEDNHIQYKASFSAIPAKLLDLAKTGQPISLDNFDLRDIVDAIISVDSRAWRLDTYIIGSVSDVVAEAAGGSTTVRAKLVYLSFAEKAWREGSVQIRFIDGRANCITYWNNRTCSANYDMFANPNADRTLTEEHKRCIKIGTGTMLQGLPRQCIIVEARTGICVQEAPQEFKEVDYRQIENTCDRSFEVVVACPLFRQRITLPSKSVSPAPGFSVMGCLLERMPVRP